MTAKSVLTLERSGNCVKVSSTDDKLGVDIQHGRMWCRACGFESNLSYPIKLIDFALSLADFEMLHRECTYTKLEVTFDEVNAFFEEYPSASVTVAVANLQRQKILEYRKAHKVLGKMEFDNSSIRLSVQKYKGLTKESNHG